MLGQSQPGKNFLISFLSTLKVSNSVETTASEKTSMKEKKANHNLLPSGDGLPAVGPSLRGLTVKEGGSKRHITFNNELCWTSLFLNLEYGFLLKENSGAF